MQVLESGSDGDVTVHKLNKAASVCVFAMARHVTHPKVVSRTQNVTKKNILLEYVRQNKGSKVLRLGTLNI